jgi:hypothetical protein
MRKCSVIWKIERSKLQELYDTSSSVSEILSFFGLKNRGSNFRTLKKRMVEDEICLNKFLENKSKSRRITREKAPLENVLIQNSKINNTNLKRRLLEGKLIENICVKCGQGPEWNGEKLVLQLEHKNGVSDDNRLWNLCLLCPNCHSQTNTFAGRKLKLNREKVVKVRIARVYPRKVERPSKEELAKMLWETPTTRIASKYGVSDKAVSKWAKKYGLEKPSRGYWGFK